MSKQKEPQLTEQYITCPINMAVVLDCFGHELVGKVSDTDSLEEKDAKFLFRTNEELKPQLDKDVCKFYNTDVKLPFSLDDLFYFRNQLQNEDFTSREFKGYPRVGGKKHA